MRTRPRREHGNSSVEMALILAPLLFLTFSTFDVARAMWNYHTLSTAVKRGARFASVHGAGCAAASAACRITVGDVAGAVRQAGFGLDPSKLQLALTAGAQTLHCSTALACSSDTTMWPAAPDNAAGQLLTINGTYIFHPLLALLWPGQQFKSFSVTARATEMIHF